MARQDGAAKEEVGGDREKGEKEDAFGDTGEDVLAIFDPTRPLQ